MSIRSVTYYQVQCDACGAVDDGGEYSAWSEPDAAVQAAESADWLCLTDVAGVAYHLCDGHLEGVLWCATCEEDLDADAWTRVADGRISQVCVEGHLNRIRIKKEARA